MNWFTNLLQTSWLYQTEFLGLNGWLWLLFGFVAVTAILAVFALVFNARVNDHSGRTSIQQADRARVLRTLFILLLAVPIFIALVIIWWDLSFLPIVIFSVLFVIALFLFIGFKLVKWAALLTILALLLAMFAFGFQLRGGLDPNAPKADCTQAEQAAEAAGITIPHYFNLEPGKPINTFGTDVVVRDEAGILQAMHDRRCVDPALTSAHLATWGVIAVNLVDEYTARFIASRELWVQAIGQMEQLEKQSMDYAKEKNVAFALEAVSTNKSTLYMESNGNGGVRVKTGQTITEGTAIVFTHPDGRVVKLRLECGLQPVFDTPPHGIPECEGGHNCLPEVCPSNPSLPPYSPDCLQSKDHALDVDENGWNVQPVGPKTTGNESEAQQESGEVDGNVIDDQVSSDTQSDDTTSDTTTGTVTVIGGAAGGDDVSNDVSDGNSAQDDDGTTGATVIVTPAD